MELPKKLVAEFAKVTNDSEKPKVETTVYGVITKNGNSTYVTLDGSDLPTPVSTTTDVEDGDRVTVLVKNHTAIVTGNMTSPSARTDDVQAMDEKFDAEIGSLKVGKLSADEAKITYATIENLEANYATIDNLEANYATIKNLEVTEAKIDKLAATDFDAKYANIDFANIGEAAVKKLFSESGIIKDLVVSGGQITGELVGVTIKGDLIEGNTVVADKLVVKGEDGLYYKLNVDALGETTASADEKYQNGLDGSVIVAKSITATKIAVNDLVAFDATIGGFNITSDELYSDVKDSLGNTTRGIHLRKDGQFTVGDSNNFLKYYKTSNGSYKLELAFGGDDIQSAIDAAASDAADADTKATNALNTANAAADAVDDAAKTATNFLDFSSNGLQIGNKSAGSWSGYRTQITSSEFNILNASGTEVASYGTNLIELGKNSTSSVIELCGGEGSISYGTNSWGGSSFKINSASPTLSGTSAATLVCASSELKRSMIRVFPTQIYMYSAASDSVASSIDMNKDYIDITANSTITLNAPTVQDSNGNKFLAVERGSSGTWQYKKWSNGDVELWGYKDVSGTACTTALGSMYRTDGITTSFPFTVYSPSVTASYESNGYGAFLWSYGPATTTDTPKYYLVRPTSATIANGKIIFHVYGKWST